MELKMSEQTASNPVVKNGNYTMENVRSMVRQMSELDSQIKDLRDERKKIISDFIDEHNVPKKEVMEAIKMVKSDIDPEVTASIYAHIADLVETK
jgi:hypothetical protein